MFRIASVLLVTVALAAVIVVNPLRGGGKALNLGDPAPTFANLPGVDGKNHSLKDYKKDVVVVCITCNHCPVAVQYEDRIIAFTKKYGDKIDLVAINVNNLEADKLPKMVERAKERGFNFPYLYDETQTIARALGATVTPHFFVFNKDRKLVYQGAMDDSNNASSAKVNFLAAAVDSALQGQTPQTTATKARGCTVKYEK